jgi:hypothetical protein
LSLSWARSIQCIPSHPISLRSILILVLSTYLRLGLFFFFNLHRGGWNQGPLDTAAT